MFSKFALEQPISCKVLNNVFINRARDRGDYPVGVTKHEDKYRARCENPLTGIRKHIGVYDTPENAFLAYKEYKEKLIEISKLLKKISPSDVCHIIKIERDENSNKTYFFVLINGSLPMCFFTKTNKKYALNKLILVTKENKIFEL